MSYKTCMRGTAWEALVEAYNSNSDPQWIAFDLYESRQWDETDFAVLWAIAQIAPTPEEFFRIWADPTPQEDKEVVQRAKAANKQAQPHLRKADKLSWGESSIEI